LTFARVRQQRHLLVKSDLAAGRLDTPDAAPAELAAWQDADVPD
jgi:hypothetical protein